jgi:orotidine-5'-phosphate decarboxylase
VNSAFIGTDVEKRLRATDIKTLVTCGATTNHRVETATRMAGNLGLDAMICARRDLDVRARLSPILTPSIGSVGPRQRGVVRASRQAKAGSPRAESRFPLLAKTLYGAARLCRGQMLIS